MDLHTQGRATTMIQNCSRYTANKVRGPPNGILGACGKVLCYIVHPSSRSKLRFKRTMRWKLCLLEYTPGGNKPKPPLICYKAKSNLKPFPLEYRIVPALKQQLANKGKTKLTKPSEDRVHVSLCERQPRVRPMKRQPQ